MTTIGERLRIARDKSGLKQTQVKERTNINNKTLSGYENNVSQPDTETLVTLAELYEVSFEWLFAGKGELRKSRTTEEEGFQSFIKDPELERWYKELPKSDEEDLRRLRRIWEAFKEDEND